MDGTGDPLSYSPFTFYIGHHEKTRRYAVTDEILHHAEDVGYDFLTARITNDSYHSKVLSQLSDHRRNCESVSGHNSHSHSCCLPAPTLSPLTASDTDISPNEVTAKLVQLTSPWLDLASPDSLIANISRQVLLQEINYAAFCGASNVSINGPCYRNDYDGITQFATTIREALQAAPGMQLQIVLPMCYSQLQSVDSDVGDLSRFEGDINSGKQRPKAKHSPQDLMDSWDTWHLIRTAIHPPPPIPAMSPPVCCVKRFSGYLHRLGSGLALIVPQQLPPISVQNRWHSEPMRILQLPRSSFTPNKFHVDVLTKAHQQLIARYMRLKSRPWLLLSDVGPLPELDESGNDLAMTNGNPNYRGPTPAEGAWMQPSAGPNKSSVHVEYLRQHLQNRQPELSAMERYGDGYQDFPQSPLQPLTDNLESMTYEVFEKDPIKYEWYERAIAAALSDWQQHKKPASAPNGRVVIAVTGAGRGPLVARALQASTTTGVLVDVWAVEKNPNAFVHLQKRNKLEWNGAVHLQQSDMRSWKGPSYTSQPPSNASAPSSPATYTSTGSHAPIDILVSELLGSFGDNELSPECIDGVQHLLSPAGISIPSAYTAHLTPIAAPKLWADIVRGSGIANGASDPTQIPYVAWLHAIDYLATRAPTSGPPAAERQELLPDVQEAWKFQHPVSADVMARASGNSHNARFAKLNFASRHRGVCHGLGGYFEAVLYGSQSGAPVELSTNPLTMDAKSKDMISWFPIFFPLKTPLYIPDDAELAVSIWRNTDGRKVWYEWMVECFVNANGKRLRTSVSELQSSVAEGCLM